MLANISDKNLLLWCNAMRFETDLDNDQDETVNSDLPQTGSLDLPDRFFEPASSRGLYWTRFLTTEKQRPTQLHDKEKSEDRPDPKTQAEQKNTFDAIIDTHRDLLADGPRPPASQRTDQDDENKDRQLAGLKAPSLLDDDDDQSPWTGTQSGTRS